jgi:hypothetical protein
MVNVLFLLVALVMDLLAAGRVGGGARGICWSNMLIVPVKSAQTAIKTVTKLSPVQPISVHSSTKKPLMSAT